MKFPESISVFLISLKYVVLSSCSTFWSKGKLYEVYLLYFSSSWLIAFKSNIFFLLGGGKLEKTFFDINNTINDKILKVLKEWEEVSKKEIIPIIDENVPKLFREGWEAEILNKRK